MCAARLKAGLSCGAMLPVDPRDRGTMSSHLFRILVLLGSLAATPAAAGQVPFELAAQPAADGIALTWRIAPNVYLYRDKIVIRTPDGTRITPALPAGDIKDDPNFGSTEVYHRAVTATIPNAALHGATRLTIGYQGCAERGICYPPATANLDLDRLTVTPAGGDDPAPRIAWPEAPPSSEAPPSPQPAFAPTEPAGSILPAMTQGWLPLLLAFAGFGLLLAFTPCVLPMLPIVAGMLTRAGSDMSPARGFALAGVCTLAMAAAYAALGVAAAWSGRNLQAALQTPAALAVMAAVYGALALSSFGLFELQLPARFGATLAGRIGGRAGPLLGAAALGFSSALIVGPCVTPPLAAALLYVAQTGDTVRGAAALFALGLGMGFPLILVGMFGAGILPRAGAWLVTVRSLFGFVFLGLAVLLVARVLPGEIALLLWAALAIGLAAFAGAFDRLDRRSAAAQRYFKAFGLALFVYAASLIVGAAAGGDDPLRPLAAFGGSRSAGAVAVGARTVTSLAGLDAAIADGRSRGKPIMIDFSADWCTACKTMEHEVFADPAVRQRLASVTLIRADVTATDPATTALMRRYDVVGPPTVVFLAADGREITTARTVGEVSADVFTRTLQRLGAPS